MVAFANERGPEETILLAKDLELRAGPVPFRTTDAVDVLPVEGRPYFKRRLTGQSQDLLDCYKQLYASYRTDETAPKELTLYETGPLGDDGVALADTADGSLWIALLLRQADPATDEMGDRVRRAIAGQTLSLGIVPMIRDEQVVLGPGASSLAAG